eukprot:XP_001709850.1 Hypothetical protein GL50803_35534 [Giardia lamblia ATCC 50803]
MVPGPFGTGAWSLALRKGGMQETTHSVNASTHLLDIVIKHLQKALVVNDDLDDIGPVDRRHGPRLTDLESHSTHHSSRKRLVLLDGPLHSCMDNM